MNTIALPGTRNFHGTDVYFDMHTLEWIRATNHTGYTTIHEQQTFEMIYVTEGSGLHIINHEEYELRKDTIYCIAPGYNHKLILDAGTKGFLLSFSESFLATHRDLHDYEPDGYIYTQFHNYPSLKVEPESAEELQDILSMVEREMKKHGLTRLDLLNRYLRIYLILFQREVISSIPIIREKTQYGLTDKFFLLLEYNFRQKKSVNAYAKELCVTPNYLNQMIKRTTGQSARYHITQRILQEAKRKLIHPDITMKEVAFMLGFEDIAHFSKFFKNGTGFTFSTLKKQCARDRAQFN